MKSLQKVAYEHLKEMILTDSFEYGKVYSETKVSKDLGISRTPMRDAIHMLVQEKYLDIIPSKGFMLHQMESADVIETFQIRSAIEGYCTLQIAQKHTGAKEQALFSVLECSLRQQKQILDTSHSVKDFVVLDNQFHASIVNFLENSVFQETFSNLLYHIKRLALLSLAHAGRMEETYKEHLAMFTAMKTGDTKQIYAITLAHMEKPKGINLGDL